MQTIQRQPFRLHRHRNRAAHSVADGDSLAATDADSHADAFVAFGIAYGDTLSDTFGHSLAHSVGYGAHGNSLRDAGSYTRAVVFTSGEEVEGGE